MVGDKASFSRWLKTMIRLDTVDSTNNYAKKLLAENRAVDFPALIVAKEQTAGRGRGSKTWWSGNGAIFMTMILNADEHRLTREMIPLFSLGIGLAVMNTVQKHAPGQCVQVKWPNDVFLEGKKISGTLIEVPKPGYFVIGTGINTNSTTREAPTEIQTRITTLRDQLGNKVNNDNVIDDFITKTENILAFFPEQIDRLTRNVQKHLFQLDQTVTLTLAEKNVTGKCLGIAPDGSLRLLTAQGEERFLSGILDF